MGFRLDTFNAEYCQTVLPEDGFVVPLTYLTDEAQWMVEHERALREPFDLLVTPPIRAVACQQPGESTGPPRLMVVVHHIAADMDAMQIIRKELSLLCSRSTSGCRFSGEP